MCSRGAGECSFLKRVFRHTPDHADALARFTLTLPCVTESDQRHAQHPLKMLGIDFSCGSHKTNSERIMLLNS